MSIRSCERLSQSFVGGRTKQSFRKQCDVNSIIDKAKKTGLVSHLNTKTPVFGNFIGVPNYQDAMDLVNKANSNFNALPSKLRERFMNDPSKLLEFINEPTNYDEAVKLGLVIPKPKVVDPVKVDDPKKDGDKK